MDSRALYLFKRHDELTAARMVFDAHCQEVAERVLPRQDEFTRLRVVEGEKRTEKIFDSTAPLALDRAASAIDSLITPSTQIYQKFEPEDDRLLEDRDVMIYCDHLTKAQFRMRYRPSANFSSQAHECFVSLMAFGNLGMFVDEVLGIGVRYKSLALPGLYFAENHAGIVDYVHYKFPLSARAAVQKWGEANLPDKIKKAAKDRPFDKFDFLHCVKPNDEMKPGAKDYRGMPWSSYYASFEGMNIVSEGGYRTMPYAISRHVTSPRETYGRSPAMMVLPDIKMLNEMEKTIIRAAHKIVSPPLLAFGDGILNAINARPDAINYGGVDDQGRQLVVPMKMGSNLPIALDMTEQKRNVINDAFYVTLFQILVRNPQMTATEALIRAQEKGQLLAPTVGRQQTEFLSPVSERELDIMAATPYMLPPMPDVLRRSGGGVKVRYTSPLTRLRRAEEGIAIMRTIEQVSPLLEVMPGILQNMDEDFVFRTLWDINGAPPKGLRAEELVAQMREEVKQAQQQAAGMEQAETMSKTVGNLARAGEQVAPQEAA